MLTEVTMDINEFKNNAENIVIKKRNKFSVFVLIFSIFFIIYEWVMWDISLIIDEYFVTYFIGVSYQALILIMFILLSIALIYAIFKFKKIGKLSLVPFGIMVLLTSCFLVKNYSVTYGKLNYYIHKNNRIETIQMYEEGALRQIDEHEYIVPNRLSSWDKVVIIGEKFDQVGAVFKISLNQAIVYTTADTLLLDGQYTAGQWYHGHFLEAEKIEEHWYIVTVCLWD